MARQFDLIVIGEGVAGLTAANSARKAGIATATFEPELFGGLVVSVNELDPPPGERPISGVELASELAMENGDLGIDSVKLAVQAIAGREGAFVVTTAEESYGAREVIVASGARLRKLGVPGEEALAGLGVSHCADCDGPLFQGAQVVVVGAGDSALQEALVLAQFCSKVYVVRRGRDFRARPEFVEKALANASIEIVDNTVVTAIEGTAAVDGVRVRTSGGDERILPCAGVFAYVGLAPNTTFLPEAVARDERGALVTAETLETSVPGIWAVGAARAGYSGLLRDAVREARAASDRACMRVRQGARSAAA